MKYSCLKWISYSLALEFRLSGAFLTFMDFIHVLNNLGGRDKFVSIYFWPFLQFNIHLLASFRNYVHIFNTTSGFRMAVNFIYLPMLTK